MWIVILVIIVALIIAFVEWENRCYRDYIEALDELPGALQGLNEAAELLKTTADEMEAYIKNHKREKP